MWGDQCNTCGAHENPVISVAPCKHCSTKICNGCRPNHEPLCEELTKRKQRGYGPTVIQHHETPSPVPDIVAILPEATKVTSQIQDETIIESENPEAALEEAIANDAALTNAYAALLAAQPQVDEVEKNQAIADLIDSSATTEPSSTTEN